MNAQNMSALKERTDQVKLALLKAQQERAEYKRLFRAAMDRVLKDNDGSDDIEVMDKYSLKLENATKNMLELKRKLKGMKELQELYREEFKGTKRSREEWSTDEEPPL